MRESAAIDAYGNSVEWDGLCSRTTAEFAYRFNQILDEADTQLNTFVSTAEEKFPNCFAARSVDINRRFSQLCVDVLGFKSPNVGRVKPIQNEFGQYCLYNEFTAEERTAEILGWKARVKRGQNSSIFYG